MKQQPTKKAPAEAKATNHQRRNMILMLALCVLVIAGVWAVRVPRSYVNMFLDHYEGTSAVLAEMKGLERSTEEEEALLPLQQDFDDWKETHLRDEAEVTAADGTRLRSGWYDAGSDVTVILLHSFDGSSEDSDYLFAPYYAEKGYNLLLPDNRNHGESEGAVTTYGMLEGDDVACWVRWLREQAGAGQRVILHGDTLGASAALAGAAAVSRQPDLAGSVAFVVAESPVVNLYDSAGYLLGKQFKLPGFMIPICDRFARDSLGKSMKEVDLNQLTDGCEAAVLLIQGTEDTVIDPAAVAAFGDQYAGKVEELFYPSAHGMVYAEHADECRTALDQMMVRYLETK